FFFSSRRRHTRSKRDWSSDVCSSDLAESTGHPFSTAYRLLGGLVESGYADFDPRTKIYTLGMEVFRLAQKVAHRRGLTGATKDLREDLTATTGESSILAVRRKDAALTVLTVDGPQFRTTTGPWVESPLHTWALGQALLAHDPNAEATIDSLDLEARTPNSITDPAQMRDRLERIREAGWAGQSEENDIGMNALAVPV